MSPRSRVTAAGLILIAAALAAVAVAIFLPRGATSSASLPHHQETRVLPAERSWGPILFHDVSAAAGIRFSHVDGATDMHYVMEVMGAGLGWIDYNQDGLIDLFLVQGAPLGSPLPDAPTSKLFRNLGDGRFEDVTARLGLGHVGCGMGVAVGDIDNDGYPDLFLTCYGKPNALYRNVSDGKGGRRFEDITARSRIGMHPDWSTRPNYSTSAAFVDIDGDGFLDLFVCSYVKVDLANYPRCKDPRGIRDICAPSAFEATKCVLYRNNGNATFTDVSAKAGIAVPGAKSLGVAALDLDDDGLVDIFVANDGVPNFLFHNRGDGTFEAMGASCGCLVNMTGKAQAYMGVDADDLDDDGFPDLYVTALTHESSTLFRNELTGADLARGKRDCRFLDVTKLTGLGPPTWFMVGFGTCLLDADNDGRLDIFQVNGHISRNIERLGDKSLTFRQQAQLFYNEGRNRFQEISSRAGPYFQERHVGRGAASADFDNDGRIDLAVSNNGEAAFLLKNQTDTRHHWIRLELQGDPTRPPGPAGSKSSRDAVGAKVTIDLGGGRKLVRHRKGGTSYLSAVDPRLLIGLGDAARVERVDIRWPSGLVQRLGPLAVDKGYRVLEGEHETVERP